MNSSWERLECVIDAVGVSVNKFASLIGLKRAEVLYRIRGGKNSISKELAEKITIKYCNISKAWLLTGEGSMYLDSEYSDDMPSSKRIPFYDAVSSVIFKPDKEQNGRLPPPLYYIEVPVLSNCDLAAMFVGESMKPEIPSGSIVTLKEVELSLVLPGEMYMIVTDIYTTIKYVRTVEGDDTRFLLIPGNTNSYDEMYLDKAFIKRIFLVKGVISAKVI